MRVAVANFNYGGIDPATGDDARWVQTVDTLERERPHIVLVQEMWAPPPVSVSRHMWRTANALAMTPVLGPVTPGAGSPLHLGVLVDTGTIGRIVEDGPPAGQAGSGGLPHAWCHVEMQVSGLDEPWHLYSVHLPARSAVMQRSEAESLGSLLSGQPLALAGGDFNTYPRKPRVDAADLEQLPAHLKVTRCRHGPHGLEPNLDVDDTLRRAGLIDIAEHLPSQRRAPELLQATGAGGARVDRVYTTPRLAAAATAYRQFPIGSDHQALLIELDLAALGGTHRGVEHRR